MANKNLGLLGLIGIPIIIGYMYWVKQSNIKELENELKIITKFGKYDTNNELKLVKQKHLLASEKKSILPLSIFPIGLGQKIEEKASDEYNNAYNAVKTFFKSMSMSMSMRKRNSGGSVKQYKKK